MEVITSLAAQKLPAVFMLVNKSNQNARLYNALLLCIDTV